ncbi:MAG: hypothetical protein H6810_09125 [Phycisphaeraceae bacterium]|nr:MAG: hypothetical protein H6810_09125 [Phycisphaeraceae bacterium]
MPEHPFATRRCIAVLMGSAALLTGCSDWGADAEAVTQSARHLAAVGSGALSDATFTYETVSREISGLKAADDSAAAAAAGLLSESRQGEGSLKAVEAMLAERALFDEIAAARTDAVRWTALSTTAQALTSYDPADDIAETVAEADRLASQAEARRADRSQLAGEVERSESRVADLRGRSNEKRNRAAELKLEAAALSAVESAKLAVAARTLSREADALDMEANRVQGEIDMLRPRLAEIEGDVQKLEEQRSLALEFGDELRQSKQARDERAVKARAEAASLGEKIRATVAEIIKQREESVEPAGDAAIDAFEQASRSSDKALREFKASGQLAKSAAQRWLGEACHLRAQGHARFASLLEELAAVSPTLPDADDYADRAAQERAAEVEAIQKAADAYERAAASLRATGLRGTEREGLEAAAADLDVLVRSLRGEPEQTDQPGDEATPAPVDEPAPDSEPDPDQEP